MEPLAPLVPAITEVNVLMDMGLIEIHQVMALIAHTVQQRSDPVNESHPLFRLGATQQLAGFLA
jgi:hypothetical protein